jgi:ferrous iron transport protein B
MASDASVARAPETARVRTVALLGNPNSGKTTVFNALTGLRQKVGNYPGVTVERKEGTAFTQHGKPLRIIDLPGSYSLHPRSPDERILVDFLLGRIPGERAPDVVLCLVDASNLERNLYLVTQILDLGFPTIIGLNMVDIAHRRGLKVDAERMSRELGVPVVPLEAHRDKGIIELRLLLGGLDLPKARAVVPTVDLVEEAARELAPSFQRPGMTPGFALAEARLSLATDEERLGQLGLGPAMTRLRLWRQRLDREIPGWRSEIITTRYAFIGELLRECLHRFNPHRRSWTDRLDHVLLHPLGGILSLALVMALLFYSVFRLAVPFMDWIDAGVGALGGLVADLMPDGRLESLLVDGVIAGVGGVVIFLPQILMLFFFISLLESSGYMARAAFILDRVMSKVGLHGRSFVPLLSSYACAVPGIMATRTIESVKDRLVTILVAPFMTCTARLPVYLVLIAALLPEGEHRAWKQAAILFALYFLGTVTALLFGLLFKKTLLRGMTPTMVLELPVYRVPQPRAVLMEMWDRGKLFVRRAGTIIFALSILLWFAMNYPQPIPPEDAGEGEAIVVAPSADELLEYSFAGRLGHAVEPLFAPLGYDWKISVGVIASFAAREVFVSTMAIIFSVEDGEDADSMVGAMVSQRRADGSPLFTPLTCFSLMVFFVFALQCLSTVAVVKRETNSWFWPGFQIVYMLAVAWLSAFAVYQGGQLLGFS